MAPTKLFLLLLLLLLLTPSISRPTPPAPIRRPTPPAPIRRPTPPAPIRRPTPPAPAPRTSPPPPLLEDDPIVLGPPNKLPGSANTKLWRTISILVVIIPPTVLICIYSVLTVLRERYPEFVTFQLMDQPGEGHFKLYLTIALVISYVASAAVIIYKAVGTR